MGNLTIGSYMNADRFFDEVEINNIQERIRILNGCPLQWIKQYNIKIVKDGLRKDNNYIEIVDIIDEEVQEITYTLKELVDVIQPILKQEVNSVFIYKTGRRYGYIETIEEEQEDKLIEKYPIHAIVGYHNIRSYTKISIKETVKRWIKESEKENEEIENEEIDIKDQIKEVFETRAKRWAQSETTVTITKWKEKRIYINITHHTWKASMSISIDTLNLYTENNHKNTALREAYQLAKEVVLRNLEKIVEEYK